MAINTFSAKFAEGWENPRASSRTSELEQRVQRLQAATANQNKTEIALKVVAGQHRQGPNNQVGLPSGIGDEMQGGECDANLHPFSPAWL